MLVREFDFLCPNGMLIAILVEYEWLPFKCSGCNIFGHALATVPIIMRNIPRKKRLKGCMVLWVLVQHMGSKISLNCKKL
jgi:hypothetical protein